ncbi:MAG: alkaline phosphatase family protein [Deltaproteobacteria bacterium]|nr:alkaline phosphatase family protein [Deltaproteobacteria bacterium]
MQRTLVLLVVGLTEELIGENTPRLAALFGRGGTRPLETIVPAVTCSVQATLLTGALPREHGIVGNGWYFRDLSEIWFWRQSAGLYSGERIWEAGRRRDPAFTAAKLFWWYSMYDTADVQVTPRPMYPADGRKLPDVWTHPAELRDDLNGALGTFPLFNFWGPRADIVSTRWVAAAARRVWETRRPTLSLVYLPHLDYCLQKYGPSSPRIAAELREVDAVAGELAEQALADGARVLVVSEYGIVDVAGPVHPNRVLREAGLLRVRTELGRELLDAGASEAFAVADHQVAHVYVKDRSGVGEVKRLLAAVPGIARVVDDPRELGLDHPRSGELVLLAEPDRWFTYYHWLDDARAPDYARTVDIHRKPGYDPVELFLDPNLRLPALKVGAKIARSKLGFRTLMDVIPLDASLVRGSHGVLTTDPRKGPLIFSSAPELLPARIHATDFKDVVLRHVFD